MTQLIGPWMPQWTWPALAPQELTQPINQGWTFGNVMVTMQNSRAPGVEHAITSKISYGRQIGRTMDAVEALVRMLPADARKDGAIVDFVSLAKEVRKVKEDAQAERLDRLKADLETLKREDPEGWKNLMKGLRP
jgi:hypothetical protein